MYFKHRKKSVFFFRSLWEKSYSNWSDYAKKYYKTGGKKILMIKIMTKNRIKTGAAVLLCICIAGCGGKKNEPKKGKTVQKKIGLVKIYDSESRKAKYFKDVKLTVAKPGKSDLKPSDSSGNNGYIMKDVTIRNSGNAILSFNFYLSGQPVIKNNYNESVALHRIRCTLKQSYDYLKDVKLSELNNTMLGFSQCSVTNLKPGESRTYRLEISFDSRLLSDTSPDEIIDVANLKMNLSQPQNMNIAYEKGKVNTTDKAVADAENAYERAKNDSLSWYIESNHKNVSSDLKISNGKAEGTIANKTTRHLKRTLVEIHGTLKQGSKTEEGFYVVEADYLKPKEIRKISTESAKFYAVKTTSGAGKKAVVSYGISDKAKYDCDLKKEGKNVSADKLVNVHYETDEDVSDNIYDSADSTGNTNGAADKNSTANKNAVTDKNIVSDKNVATDKNVGKNVATDNVSANSKNNSADAKNTQNTSRNQKK